MVSIYACRPRQRALPSVDETQFITPMMPLSTMFGTRSASSHPLHEYIGVDMVWN